MVMIMLELRGRSGSPPDLQNSCFSFCYRTAPEAVRHAGRIRLGTELLTRVVSELRKRGHESSTPSKGTFGITGTSCRVGQQKLTISAWPPEKDNSDRWQLRTYLAARKQVAGATESELAIWAQICMTIKNVLEVDPNVHDLRWMSWEEAESESRR